MKKIFFWLFLSLWIIRCKTPELGINPELKADAMAVKGRNGWLLKQTISYGDFKTDKVRRGWTRSYNFPFFLRFQGAKEKLSFTQFGPNGTSAKVAFVSSFKTVELPLVNSYFNVPVSYKNFFAGTVVLNNGVQNWDFIIHNPDGDFMREKASAGMIKNGTQVVEIHAIRSIKGQPKWLEKLAVYGHEFSQNGKVVAAISNINKGTVWIDPALDSDRKTLIAAVATGLLLRRDMEEAVPQ